MITFYHHCCISDVSSVIKHFFEKKNKIQMAQMNRLGYNTRLLSLVSGVTVTMSFHIHSNKTLKSNEYV